METGAKGNRSTAILAVSIFLESAFLTLQSRVQSGTDVREIKKIPNEPIFKTLQTAAYQTNLKITTPAEMEKRTHLAANCSGASVTAAIVASQTSEAIWLSHVDSRERIPTYSSLFRGGYTP